MARTAQSHNLFNLLHEARLVSMSQLHWLNVAVLNPYGECTHALLLRGVKYMKDPNAEEMMKVLTKAWNGLTDLDTIEQAGTIAIYWFAYAYHGGQTSNLYEVLSTSEYSPGPLRTADKDRREDDVVSDMYDTLVEQFTK